jgi:hypothetical protein
MAPCHSFPSSATFAAKDGNGAARGIRTPDPLITNEVLYQLSYCGIANVAIREAALLPPRLPVGKAGKAGKTLPDRKNAAARGRLLLRLRHVRRRGREDYRSRRRQGRFLLQRLRITQGGFQLSLQNIVFRLRERLM